MKGITILAVSNGIGMNKEKKIIRQNFILLSLVEFLIKLYMQ